MWQWVEASRASGRREDVIGWYHSHPGYGPWLSGIDVMTQKTNQMQGPFVAVVVDPVATVSAGRVSIGAFRTYPEGYRPEKQARGIAGSAAVPVSKMEDYGVHADQVRRSPVLLLSCIRIYAPTDPFLSLTLSPILLPSCIRYCY